MSVLVLICDSVKSESTKTVFLCYKLREKFPENSQQQKDFFIVAQIIEKSAANFTAAGFYPINRNTLFGILATTATYLVVTIQFTENLNN